MIRPRHLLEWRGRLSITWMCIAPFFMGDFSINHKLHSLHTCYVLTSYSLRDYRLKDNGNSFSTGIDRIQQAIRPQIS